MHPTEMLFALLSLAGAESDVGNSSTLTSLLLLEKDVFTCSELERASFCLAAADDCLRSLQHFLDSGEQAVLILFLFYHIFVCCDSVYLCDFTRWILF